MKLDDPKLTAYALGELEEPERSELEEMLRADPEALEAIASLKSFTAQLRAELQHEKMPGLTADQRAEVLAAARAAAAPGAAASARSDDEPFPRRPSPWRVWIPAALAAGFAIATTIGLHHPDDEEAIPPSSVSQVRNSPVSPATAAPPASAAPHASTVFLAATASPAPRPDAVLPALPSQSRADEADRWGFATKGPVADQEQRLLRESAAAAQPALPEVPLVPPSDFSMRSDMPPHKFAEAKTGEKMLALEQGRRAAPISAPAPAPAPGPHEPQKDLHSGVVAAPDSADDEADPIAAPEVPAVPEALAAQMNTDGILPAPDGSLAKKTAPQKPAPANKFARRSEAQSHAEGLVPPPSIASANNQPPKPIWSESLSTPSLPLPPLPQEADGEAARQQFGSVRPTVSIAAGIIAPERLGGAAATVGKDTSLSYSVVKNEGSPVALATLGYALPRKDSAVELAKLSPATAPRPADAPVSEAETVPNALGLNDRGATPQSRSYARGGAQPSTADSRGAIENPFIPVRAHSIETFPLQLGLARSAELRGYLAANQRPPENDIRLGELINEFSYQDAPASGNDPITVALEVASCPWAPGHRLLRVALRGREAAPGQHLPVNLVLMVDNSGKAAPAGNLPLLKESLRQFVGELGPADFVGIAANPAKPAAAAAAPTGRSKAPASSSASDVAFLESTRDKAKVLSALDSLQPADAPGAAPDRLQSAYALADRHYIPGGTNAILSTDDYAVETKVAQETLGRPVLPTKAEARGDLALRVIHLTLSPSEASASTGLNDLTTPFWSSTASESLAAPSPGANLSDANAFAAFTPPSSQPLAAQLSQSLVIVAREVELEMEFNPAEVGSYRLIGAETQPVAETKTPLAQNRGTPQAGDLGSGQAITALYELAPPAFPSTPPPAPPTILAAKAAPKHKEVALNETDADAVSGKAAIPEIQRTSGGRKGTPPAQPILLAQTPPGKLFTLRLHWKAPESIPPAQPETREYSLFDSGKPWTEASEDFRWSAAVASFGLLLRDSPYKGEATWQGTLQLATGAKGPDASGQRQEFIGLVEKAKATLGGK